MTSPTSSAEPARHGELAVLAASVMFYSVGNVAGWLSPQVLVGAMQQFHTSAALGGLVTMVEGVTAGLGAMLLGAYPPNRSFRQLGLVSLAVLIVLNAVSLSVNSYAMLLGLRFLAGICDAVLTFVAVSLIAALTRNPDRGYAAANVVGNIYGAIVLATLPLLFASLTGLAYLPYSAAVGMIVAPLALLTPAGVRPARRHQTSPDTPTVAITRHGKLTFALLLVVLIPQTFQAFMQFTFSLEIGARMGLSSARVSTILGAATLASVAGPFLAASAAQYLGRWIPTFAMAVLFCISSFTFTMQTDAALFAPCLVVNLVAAYFFVPMVLAWSANIDPSGRFGSIAMGVMSVVAATSPPLAGALVDRSGLLELGRVVVVCSAAILTGLILLQLVSYKHRKANDVHEAQHISTSREI